jgi:sugar/nucleoside kinase (ribokinase family)
LVSVNIISHLVLDNIITPQLTTQSLGGPSSYAGLSAKQMGAHVTLSTKFGLDFPESYVLWLSKNGLRISDNSVSRRLPTTRFELDYTTGEGRKLRLISRCEDISLPDVLPVQKGRDAVLISPVIGEFPANLIHEVKSQVEYVVLDPQGYLRRVGESGEILPDQGIDLLNFRGIDAIKVDDEELKLLAKSNDRMKAIENLKKTLLASSVISTCGSDPVIFSGPRGVFRIPVPKSQVVDQTGTGDIMCGVFTASYVQYEDELKACCDAIAAASIAVQRIGISKVPNRDEIGPKAEKILRSASKIS